MSEQVILVNEMDQEVGQMEKMQAHFEAVLHRAFSVFLFNDQGDMLIHRRALEKYHSGGLWTNACCSHPKPGESIEQAAHRRLQEELNIDCAISEVYSFIYKAELDQGLTEHEFDHVLFGRYNRSFEPNPEEVMDWKYVPITALRSDIKNNPDRYTEWFKIAIQGMEDNGIKLELQ